jgi:hypothetical protein
MLLVTLGLGTLPVSPVAAANCANIGPGANLAGCDLSWLDLSGVNLAGANLRGANLTGTNLDGANLSGANLSNARVTEGALDSANTAGANLRGIRWAPAPVFNLTFLGQRGDELDYQFTGSGFEPSALVWFDVTNSAGTFEDMGASVVQADGTFSQGLVIDCNTFEFGGQSSTFTADDGSVRVTAPQQVVCP